MTYGYFPRIELARSPLRPRAFAADDPRSRTLARDAPRDHGTDASKGTAQPAWLGQAGWALYDCAAQPYYSILAAFIFAPYFVGTVIGDPAEGQALLGYALGLGGLIAAILSPIFGAISDAAGRRKPWLFAFSAIYVVMAAAHWFAYPGAPHGIAGMLAVMVMAGIALEFAYVFYNAMLPDVAPPQQMGRLSGFGFAAGYFGGLIAIMLLLVLVSLPGLENVSISFLPADPLLALDADAHEPTRFSGPFSALWFIVFVLPLFLFAPDHRGEGRPFREAVRHALQTLSHTIRRLPLRPYRDLTRFLLARMLFNDGLNALFVFGMVYAIGLFAWGPGETGVAGVFLILAAAVGAVAGGFLDRHLGPKRTVIIGVSALLVGTLGAMSIGPESVLFGLVQVPPSETDGFMSSWREITFLIAAAFIGAGGGPTQSASRTLMARLAPEENVTEAFGLYALSGRITAFMGPVGIGIVTHLVSQRAGLGVVAVLLVGGLLLFLPLKLRRAPAFRG